MGLRIAAGAAALLAIGAIGAGCGDGAEGRDGDDELVLLGYSTARDVYESALIPAFERTRRGDRVEISVSTGPSALQERAVRRGRPADVVALAVEPEIDRLVADGAVPPTWDSDNVYSGIVATSLIVFIVRDGNPEDVRDWPDLLRDGVDVLMASPRHSGAGRWAAMAAYGSRLHSGETDRQARRFVKRQFARATLRESGAEALRHFLAGEGDVLVGYESDALRSSLEYVVPRRPIQVELPLAATTRGGALARRFVRFARDERGQRLFARRGYRPIMGWLRRSYGERFRDPPGLFPIAAFGGWDAVDDTFFAPGSGAFADLDAAGVTTAK